MLAFGAVVLSSIALAGIVSISITRPLRQMREAVTQVGRGDFTVRAGEVDKRGEMGELARAFNAMTSELGLRVEELTRSNADNEVVEGELRAARRIQASLLPTTFPPFPERPEFELFASNAPATHAGGDFYDFFFRSEHELVIVMADVSGKGVPAALLMAVSRTIIHNLGVQGLAPERILSETNRRLVADSIGSMYVTAFVAIYDTRNGHIRYANGAHLAPLRVTTDGRVETVAEPTGALVGILEDCEYTRHVLPRTRRIAGPVYRWRDRGSCARR
jgi:sigma-B regulation protein RsbU (phosphoserine phosphatase)